MLNGFFRGHADRVLERGLKLANFRQQSCALVAQRPDRLGGFLLVRLGLARVLIRELDSPFKLLYLLAQLDKPGRVGTLLGFGLELAGGDDVAHQSIVFPHELSDASQVFCRASRRFNMVKSGRSSASRRWQIGQVIDRP